MAVKIMQLILPPPHCLEAVMAGLLNESATHRKYRRNEFLDIGRAGCPPDGVGSVGKTACLGCNGGMSRSFLVFSCSVSCMPHR